jgi:hypothetical protein
MRKFILIAAMVLASAAARADDARSLTQGPNDQPAAAGQTQPTEASKVTETPGVAETPKFVERPSAVDATATTEQPKTGVARNPAKDAVRDSAKPVVAEAPKAQKQKHKRYWTEGRIIGELHRHGVYW